MKKVEREARIAAERAHFHKHYMVRKTWRVKLNEKRNKDNDHSDTRYKRDASVLNRAMSIYKIEGRKASW